jgi:hypothetical protein
MSISNVMGDDFGDALLIAVNILNEPDQAGERLRDFVLAAMAVYNTGTLLEMVRTLHMARGGDRN